MDQQAKKHLQEEFDAALEEKDQMITVLQTQVCSLIYAKMWLLPRISFGKTTDTRIVYTFTIGEVCLT